MFDFSKYTADFVQAELPEIFNLARQAASLDDLRQSLSRFAHRMEFETFDDYESVSERRIIRVRDCARSLNRILTRRSEDKSGFSVAGAIWDIALGHARPDLGPGFYAELFHLFLGLQGRGMGRGLADIHLEPSQFEGREAAIERSQQLDELSREVEKRMARFACGMESGSIRRREFRRGKILKALGGSLQDWFDWNWQTAHIMRDAGQIASLLVMSEKEKQAIDDARAQRLPFGITPYYLSLMDEEADAGRDRAVRAQVIPPSSYVELMAGHANNAASCLDFMRESDTSPIDLITRRYPSICILKPFNTCPQICVYCQRNWEIEDAMAPGALASEKEIDAALAWIAQHPSIHEVLVTGGDPLAMQDRDLERVLTGVAAIESIERIRIGSRTLVTMPMRMTDKLADMLARYRIAGQRQVAVVTHIQHSYELTPDTLDAVEKLKTRGIPVFNQLVFTFFISRRFEAAFLRRQLALLGIEPYYAFNTKGKEETLEYRVPIARLLQEQKEEARLLPGLSRTDEAVYNVPGLGKNYLRALQHRDLISILPDGARLYEFHPWEKNISKVVATHISEDVPILDYLQRLAAIGEDVSDYETIWYYF
jgi:lysine 2,3-aminomutase